MSEQTVIDLYVPAHAASLEKAASVARRQGVDAIVWVVDDPEELPDPDELSELGGRNGHARVYPACVASGPGYRYVLLVPNWADTPLFTALEALDSAEAVIAATAEVGGCALPVGPRHGNDASVNRSIATHDSASELGVVALLAGGKVLARDLDIEDTRTAGRRVLAGTGPFGAAEDIGRFATLLPCGPDSLIDILAKLERGCGIGLEMVARPESAGPPKKKKRRRRRRGRKRSGADEGGGNQDGGGDPTGASGGDDG